MGDKSPKSKQRDEKQKSAAKTHGATTANAKQAAQGQRPVPPAKGKK